jgi:CubicO group peptidase (beta-lactamase class C family)
MVRNGGLPVRHVLFLIAAILTSASSSAERPKAAHNQSAEVDSAVRQEMRQQRIPGIAVAVVLNGRIIKAKGYGFANVELDTPVSPKTIFEAGSITKQFVASAIMQLAEEGKLSLDDSIAKYFPETPPAFEAVTIRQLLTHTSGIPDVSDGTAETAGTAGVIDFHREYTEGERASAYLRQTPQYPAGTRWSYCNACYDLLGFLIHRVTSKPYPDVLRESIFDRVGMSTARPFNQSNIIPNRASGYTLVAGTLQNDPDWWWSQSIKAGAAGGLWMSVLDLAKWDGGDRILTRKSLETLRTPVPLDDGSAYPGGMGWFIANAKGHKVAFHTNGGPGFSGVIARYLDDRLTIVVLTNLGAHHTDVMRISGKIAEIYLPSTKDANPVKDW